MQDRRDRSPWAEERLHCQEHGWHKGLICPACYDKQAERVEQESAPLREANTTESLRARVVEALSSKNGHP